MERRRASFQRAIIRVSEMCFARTTHHSLPRARAGLRPESIRHLGGDRLRHVDVRAGGVLPVAARGTEHTRQHHHQKSELDRGSSSSRRHSHRHGALKRFSSTTPRSRVTRVDGACERRKQIENKRTRDACVGGGACCLGRARCGAAECG